MVTITHAKFDGSIHQKLALVPTDTDIKSLQKNLVNAIKYGGDEEKYAQGLNMAVTKFRDEFTKLSLWQRILDFFGLSDTAYNQRDMATLYIASTFLRNNSEPLSCSSNSAKFNALCKSLEDAGLSESGITSIGELIASTTARLLAREPRIASHLCWKNTKLENLDPDPGSDSNGVYLSGQLSFRVSENGRDEEEFLQDLPFDVLVDGPLVTDNPPEIFNDNNNASIFTILFEHLPPEIQLQQQLQSGVKGFPMANLFSAGGLLAGITPMLDDTPVELFYSWDAIIKSKVNESKTSKSATSVRLVPYMEFKHKMSPTKSPQAEMLCDVDRGGLSQTRLTVNGQALPPDVTREMQRIAENVQEDDNAPITVTEIKLLGTEKERRKAAEAKYASKINNIGEAWSNLIQKNLKTDIETANTVAATVMYSIFQGGAGRSNTGALSSFKTPRSPYYENITLQQTMHIDTRQAGRVSVAMGEFVVAKQEHDVNLKEFWSGEVMFSLSLPKSKKVKVPEIAAGFTRQNIGVTGLGVRQPMDSANDILEILDLDRSVH